MSAADYIEGFYIRYHEYNNDSSNGSIPVYQVLKINNSATSTYILNELKTNTFYEVFLAPFYKSIDGQPSNFKLVSTLEDGRY